MTETYIIEPFKVPFKTFQLIGERWCTKGQLGELLLLHGAGHSSRNGFLPLRKTLIENGIGSVAFDFLGHGDTGGSLLGFSLVDRIKQTLAVMDALMLDRKSLNVMGFSMGAYIAIQISAVRHIARLGLAIPAVYSPRALHLPFGPSFSQCIRQPDSWRDSDGFEILKKFTGRLLVISAERDQIIPAEIPHRLFQSASRSTYKAHHRIMGAGHNLGQHYAHSPHSRYLALQSITAWHTVIGANDEQFFSQTGTH